MLTFLLFSLFALVAFGLTGALALPLVAIAAVVWLVTLPFRLLFGLVFGVLGGLFRLVFGIGGALIGIILFPLVIVVAGIALVGAFVAAMLALLTPLIPVVLLALLGWGIYRASRPRTSGLAQP